MTILIVSIGMTGIIALHYYGIDRSENAKEQIIAAHVGHMVSEFWISREGDEHFNLSNYTFNDDFQVNTSIQARPQMPSGYVPLPAGCYDIRTEGYCFQTTLAYKNAEDIPNTRYLYIYVKWTDRAGNKQNYVVSSITQHEDTGP